MKWLLTAVIVCTYCLAATCNGQAQNAAPHGPIILEVVKPTQGPALLYSLRLLQVADTKPVEHIWILQEQTAPASSARIEPNETAFRSLNSPVLRRFISNLPQGSRIVHAPIMLPGPDPTMKVSSASEPGLQELIKFCSSKKVDFTFGVLF